MSETSTLSVSTGGDVVPHAYSPHPRPNPFLGSSWGGFLNPKALKRRKREKREGGNDRKLRKEIKQREKARMEKWVNC